MMKKNIINLTILLVSSISAIHAMDQQTTSYQKRIKIVQSQSRKFDDANPYVVIDIREKVTYKKNPHPKECGCTVLFRKCFIRYMENVVDYWLNIAEIEKDS